MALQTTFRWLLGIGETSQYIDEDILDSISIDNQENERPSDFSILQLLQEVYYVDQLNRWENNEPNDLLSTQDNIYDYIRIFHGKITDILGSHHHDLINEIDSKEIRDDLRYFTGADVGNYVQENLPEPSLSRDVAYMIFNLLPSSYKHHLPHYARRDIVSSYICFERYWNKGMALLSEMQNDVHIAAIDELKKLLSELSRKNKKLCNRYLGEKKGCFSLTKVRKTELNQDVLCFSGLGFPKKITDAIDCIVNSGHFVKPFVIMKSDKVRYYLCPERFVTYADACRTNKAHKPRMFSCCERKTFAEYDWQDVDSYVMIVKYEPCELCQLPVYLHTRKYRGIVKAGIKCNPLKDIPLFDAIAEEIYKEIH